MNVIREFWQDEYKGEILLIGKVLQEIEESSDNMEKRAEIRSDRNMIRFSMLGHNRDVGSSTENRDVSTHYTVKKRVH